MTSLDDSIICSQNLMLLDNVTNYNNVAIDYYHTKLSMEERRLSYSLLLKMKKHKLLRLPSCSMEDEIDYKIYLHRLHHCIWRGWSIDFYGLQNHKMNPALINWDKENDMIVLYGPNFSSFINSNKKKNEEDLRKKTLLKQMNIDMPISIGKGKNNTFSDSDDVETLSNSDSDSGLFSSSVDSDSSSAIFDSSSILKNKSQVLPSDKKLRFSNVVKKRDITTIDNKDKKIDETFITINDRLARRSKRHLLRSNYYNTINNNGSNYDHREIIINENLIKDNNIQEDILDDTDCDFDYDIHTDKSSCSDTFYDCIGNTREDEFIFFN